jgi:hypothetical protein
MTKRINRQQAEVECLKAFRQREGREPTPAELSKAVATYLRGFRETDRAVDGAKRWVMLWVDVGKNLTEPYAKWPSFLALCPGSICQLAPEHADAWIPVTSTGMTSDVPCRRAGSHRQETAVHRHLDAGDV